MNALISTALSGVLMMFAGLFVKNKQSIKFVAIVALLICFAANLAELCTLQGGSRTLYGMITVSNFSVLFNAVAFGATLLYFMLSGSAFEKVGEHVSDYFALIFFILSGITLAASFSSLLMLFLAIEIISIPQYILAGSDKKSPKSSEAALKYFLMGSFSTGILLMGITLIYGASGSFLISELGIGEGTVSPLALCGVILVAFALSFKVSAAPFHFWTPDVYDGSPSVFTSFMATVVKAGSFIAFIRLFHGAFTGTISKDWQLLLALITAATLIIGNFTAVFQQSVKRMLAYSSIAQAGFMLLSVISFSDFAGKGIILYAAAYSIATIGIFAVLIKMKDYTFDGFNGLAKKEPLVAAVTTICLLSLAGIPLTAGFFAKYYVLTAAVQEGNLFWLVIIAVICAAISVYYYFRVIMAMYFKSGEPGVYEMNGRFKFLLVVTAAIVILLGVFPGLLLQFA
ncbi:NADH-quinone oxidoreductase subunit N [Chitinophaga sancti]|uniref:NADH-quinone oxidoreductase subunit N n=1 Tax=Chitinophaga sancti TaxID=1004 RepID=A0A1K1PDM6_9BACT|nr:NADH-quinone oxidoreductase subunit N [Chitinophaga sancti]WQD65784.1 NADH-quinone oxidoreductase subunit N [Chitinophaga sancti]WQG88594.1 NADH-quinone oxidoreductase subunit N [Chitinophaga sancti]SFW45585.1 NADH-quinone oxidoreductase subunit N [Chitinophaga sancti]